MGTFKFISTWKTPTNPIVVHAFDVSPSQLESHALVRSGTVRVHRSVVSNRTRMALVEQSFLRSLLLLTSSSNY